MHQQVNLFQPVFRKERKIFSARTLALICLLALGVLLGIYGYFRWQLVRLDATVAQLQHQYESLNSRYRQLHGHSPKADRKALEKEVADLEAKLKDRQDTLGKVHALLGRNGSYAAAFAALAHEHLPGLWLTGVRIGNQGDTIELTGVALAAELVPSYLQALPGEAPFADVNFATVKLGRDHKHHGRVDFVLRAGPPFQDELPAGVAAALEKP